MRMIYRWGELMEPKRLATTCALVAVMALAGCGHLTQTGAVPSASVDGAKAPRHLSAHARQYVGALSAKTSETVDTHIQQEAAKGARVFRVAQVAVFDPATRSHYVALRDQVEQTTDGIILFPGPHQIVLSKEAKIVSTSNGYLFRHGSERDPDADVHAVRVR